MLTTAKSKRLQMILGVGLRIGGPAALGESVPDARRLHFPRNYPLLSVFDDLGSPKMTLRAVFVSVTTIFTGLILL